MIFSKYLDKHEQTIAENKILKFAIVVIALAAVISAGFTYSAVKYQKVIILPPALDKKIVISGTDVNDNYLKLYGKYATSLLLNYTPATFPDQFADLLTLTTPSFHDSLEVKLKDIGRGIEKLNISSSFFPGKIKINRKHQEIVVEGVRDQRARNQAISNDTKKYVIKYIISNGRFQINGLGEKA